MQWWRADHDPGNGAANLESLAFGVEITTFTLQPATTAQLIHRGRRTRWPAGNKWQPRNET